MRTWFLAVPVSLLALVAKPADAAEVTDIPPWLRGDFSLGYTFSHTGGSLVEGNTSVGTRNMESHQISYEMAFAPGPGVAVFFELPHTAAQRISFPTASEMIYDPSTEAGSMVGTTPMETSPVYEGSGLGGLWMGVRGTPFSEAFESRGNLATWLVEGAWQTADPTNFWAVSDGERGNGPGGSAFRLRMGFSTNHKPAQPYIAATFTRRNPFETDIYDENGAVMVPGVTFNPPSDILVRTGVELTAFSNPEAQSFFNFDLRLAYGYTTWQTVQSGVLLPSVLVSSQQIAVTESEYSSGSAGLGLYLRPFRYMQINVWGDAWYTAPHQIEHPYPVFTGTDTIRADIGANLKLMIR